jgi:surface antigen
MALLVVLVLLGSSLKPTANFQDYQSLQASILKQSEIAAIAKSIDQYTPVIDESKLDSAPEMVDNSEISLVSSRGYISQPEIVLASFENRAGLDIDTPKTRKELIEKYKVKSGESISAIANKYGINVSTIRWANQLSNLDYIKPGQKLIIPRKNGVWHTVEDGETLSSLVAKYDGNLEATLAFNGLGEGNKIKQYQKLLIVGGEKIDPQPRVASADNGSSYSTATSNSSSVPNSISASGSSYNRFPYGWCTWYVASRRNVPWSGNAGAWLYNARAMGYSTGHSPTVGAIVVTNESWVGHVAIVEAVYGNQVKISEMNGTGGWGVVSTRTIPTYSSRIMGYIY